MPTPLRASDYLVFDGAQIGRNFASNYLANREYERRKAEDDATLTERRLAREQQASEGALNRAAQSEIDLNRSDREDTRQQSYLDRVIAQQAAQDARAEAAIASREKIAGAEAFAKTAKPMIDWLTGRGVSGRGDGLGQARLDLAKVREHNRAVTSAHNSDPVRKATHKIIVDENGLNQEVPIDFNESTGTAIPVEATPNVRKYTYGPKGLIPEGSDVSAKDALWESMGLGKPSNQF